MRVGRLSAVRRVQSPALSGLAPLPRRHLVTAAGEPGIISSRRRSEVVPNERKHGVAAATLAGKPLMMSWNVRWPQSGGKYAVK